jgi:hypothetical protein
MEFEEFLWLNSIDGITYEHDVVISVGGPPSVTKKRPNNFAMLLGIRHSR